VHEGVLRGYIRDADGGRSDLVVAGMLLTDGDQVRAGKVRNRMLSSTSG